VNLLRWVREHKHRAWGIFWILAIVPTLIWWKDSVLWVALMSLYANAETAFGADNAQQAAKANQVTPVRHQVRRVPGCPRSARRTRRMVRLTRVN
jgi:hypothetical protein